MIDDLTTQETIVVASFATRIEADTAGDVLGEHGIDSIVLNDEGPRPPFVAVPARLAVLRWQEEDAVAVLQKAALLPDDATPSYEPAGPWTYAALAALIAGGIAAFLTLR